MPPISTFAFNFSPSLLPAERAALGEARLATGRLAEDRRAGAADDDRLGVGKDGGDVEAAGTLDVHEEGVGGGYEALMELDMVASRGGY